jgi:hypothetical protein
MGSFLANYLPSLVAALIAVLSIFSGQVQSLIVAHPAIGASLAALYAILTHVLPGSPLPGSDARK